MRMTNMKTITRTQTDQSDTVSRTCNTQTDGWTVMLMLDEQTANKAKTKYYVHDLARDLHSSLMVHELTGCKSPGLEEYMTVL